MLAPAALALILAIASMLPIASRALLSHEPTLEVAQEAWLHSAFYFPGIVTLLFGLFLSDPERQTFRLALQSLGATLSVFALAISWLCAQRRHQLVVLARLARDS